MAAMEPDWNEVAGAIVSGEMRVTDAMANYTEHRRTVDHAEAARRAQINRVQGFIVRRRLIDGFRELERLKAARPA